MYFLEHHFLICQSWILYCFQPPDKIIASVNPNRPLPNERKPQQLEYGYVEPEPESVSPGRLSLKQALQLLSKYQLDKAKNNVKSLAAEYNLSEKDVGEFFCQFTDLKMCPVNGILH